MSVDPLLTRGLKLLFSNEPDAADQLRAMLDEALMNKYGVKLKLPQHIPVEEPKNPDDTNGGPSKCEADSPPPSDDSNESAPADFEDSFSMHLTDLTCVVCGQLNVGVRNQLMECNGCQHLYHQDCHKPPVKELANASCVWKCADCVEKKQREKAKSDASSSGGKSSSSSKICSSLDAATSTSQSTSKSSPSHHSSSKHRISTHDSSLVKKKRHSSSSTSHHSSSHHKSSSSNRHSR